MCNFLHVAINIVVDCSSALIYQLFMLHGQPTSKMSFSSGPPLNDLKCQIWQHQVIQYQGMHLCGKHKKFDHSDMLNFTYVGLQINYSRNLASASWAGVWSTLKSSHLQIYYCTKLSQWSYGNVPFGGCSNVICLSLTKSQLTLKIYFRFIHNFLHIHNQ